MQTYSFQYFATSNSFAFDDFNALAKIGPLIKKEFPFPNLQHFYVFAMKTHQVLYLSYLDAKGKTKTIQLLSNLGETGFFEVVKALEAKVPSKSLNNLPEKEAFKIMKAANPRKLAPVIAFGLIFLVLGIFMYPALRHNLDSGHKEVTIDELTSGSLDTRNVTLMGTPLDYGLEETTTSTHNGSTTTTKSSFIPIVGPDWKEGDPVKVIMEFKEMTDDEYSAALDQEKFTGVVRDIWWEGIASKNVDWFKQNHDLKFDGTPILVEITGQEHNDGYAIWVLVGVGGILLIICVIAAIRMRKS